jgi:D-lactate dehydrogenase
MVDVRPNWPGCSVEDGGGRPRGRPGTILAHANARLRKYGRRLGPNPASGYAATIGGVIANNARGMRCTLQRDAYHTVSALRLHPSLLLMSRYQSETLVAGPPATEVCYILKS